MIHDFYRENRRAFPWRETKIPYRIAVSEIMLQQTQTDRVRGYYQRFLKELPSVRALAEAPLEVVLKLWQGLGYNRRARFLREMALVVMQQYRGRIPQDPLLLKELPGIGSYTANAIAVFAFDKPLPLIETNIRAVYIDSFFRGRNDVHDRELLPLIEATIDRNSPREWFYALMDYGSALKKRDRKITGRSLHYIRQSRFAGSRRQLRGAIIRRLLEKGALRIDDFSDLTEFSEEIRRETFEQLSREGLIIEKRKRFRIVNT